MNITVNNFIDSDTSFTDKNVHGYKVFHPKDLDGNKKINDKTVILVAVALKEEEIISQIKNFNIFSCFQ